MATRRGLDAVGVQVLRYALASIADEMHTTLVRSAQSTNIKDREDTSSSIFTLDGELVAQSERATPVHLGTNQFLVRNLLDKVDWGSLGEGDGIVTNLPYPLGPGHLNDVAVVSPILRGGRLVAIAANQAHHVDMGGFAPGSMPFGVHEIYQEGLQIPPIRLFSGGRLDPVAFPILAANVRTPREFEGDIGAQIVANGLASRRLNELMDREGEATIFEGFAALLDYAERRSRAAIRRIPEGVYAFDDVIEGDGLSDKQIHVRVTVTVLDDEMEFDFSASDDAVRGPVNCLRPSVAACVYYLFKALVGSDLPANAGAYRPIRILLREGSLFAPRYPAAVCNSNIVTTQRIVDAALGALATALPDRIGAASSGTMNLLNFGTETRSGVRTTFVETYGGGQGGLPGQDGMDGVQTHMTNTRNAPVEVIERTYRLFVEGYGLLPNSGGTGRWRGGCGIWRSYRMETDTTVTLSTDRMVVAPWGLAGGGPGAVARFTVREQGRERIVGPKQTFNLPAGSHVRIETPGGGGYGPPEERDPGLSEQDRRSGLVS